MEQKPFIINAIPFHPTAGDEVYNVHVMKRDDGHFYLALVKEGETDATWGTDTLLDQTGAYALLKVLEAIVTPVKEDEYWKDWDPNVRMTKETIAAYMAEKGD